MPVSFSNALTESSEELADKIKEVRQALGLTQEQFALKLGVTFPTVNRWENLKTKPSPLALQKLRKLLSNHSKKGILTDDSSNKTKSLKESKS